MEFHTHSRQPRNRHGKDPVMPGSIHRKQDLLLQLAWFPDYPECLCFGLWPCAFVPLFAVPSVCQFPSASSVAADPMKSQRSQRAHQQKQKLAPCHQQLKQSANLIHVCMKSVITITSVSSMSRSETITIKDEYCYEKSILTLLSFTGTPTSYSTRPAQECRRHPWLCADS